VAESLVLHLKGFEQDLKVFASLLWWILSASLAMLLWESYLNTWVTFWVGFGLGFHVV